MPPLLRAISFSLMAIALTPALGPPAVAQTESGAPADKASSQPVQVANLIGLPIVDQSGTTLGHVRAVAGTVDGKFELIMPLGGLFGFGERLVPIPFESVVLTGARITVIELPADRFQKSPTWYGSNSEELAKGRTIRIGVNNH